METPNALTSSNGDTKAPILGGKEYDVVIVGGGPSGLACAITLADHGVRNIAVLEAKPDLDVMEWARSYCYRIDGHGSKWLTAVNAMDKLRQGAIKTPDNFTFWGPDGRTKSMYCVLRDVHQESYWLWRPELLHLLAELLEARHPGVVDIYFGTKCEAVERQQDAGGRYTLSVTAVQTQSGTTCRTTLHPRFVIGSDGVHSTVRQALQQWDDRFRLHHVPHLTVGIPYKSFTVTLSETPMHSGAFGIVMGHRQESLGLFPQRAGRVRLLGVARHPSHPIWKVATVDELYRYLQSLWPQVPWRTTLSTEHAAAFVESPPVVFPPVSYCTDFQVTLPAAQPHPILGDRCGVLLIGDAVHCFPPDIGQGVNASLEDVYVLHEVLASKKTLSDALPAFEHARREDIRAVAHLLPIAFPYQYDLPHTLHKVYWYTQFIVRFVASKLAPFLITEPVAFELQNPRHSYSDLLRRHQRNTLRLQASAVVAGIGAVIGWCWGWREAASWAATFAVGGVAAALVWS